MPIIRINDADIFYVDSGEGAETIVFAHGYLMTHEMYRAQIDALKDRYRCIAYDHRGHGQSKAVADRYGMEDIYADGEALIEALNCGPCHFVGMSTGGFVGLRLGLRRPDLLKSLILIDTSADVEVGARRIENDLMLIALHLVGVRPLISRALKSLFHAKFLNDPECQNEVQLWRESMQALDGHAIYKFGRGIFSREPVVEQLPNIHLPTVIMVGEYDQPTPPVASEQMVAKIPDATLQIIPDAGHTSPVEEPEAVIAVMNEFLAGLE